MKVGRKRGGRGTKEPVGNTHNESDLKPFVWKCLSKTKREKNQSGKSRRNTSHMAQE